MLVLQFILGGTHHEEMDIYTKCWMRSVSPKSSEMPKIRVFIWTNTSLQMWKRDPSEVKCAFSGQSSSPSLARVLAVCLLFLLLPCSFFPLPTAMHSGKCTACVSVAGIPQLRVTISNSTSRTTFRFAVTTKGKTSIKASNIIRARELYLA